MPYSLYLHVPFCRHRCGYCDFNTYAGLDELIPAYADALAAEARYFATASGEKLPLHTIFFGGGTPSLLPVKAIEKILNVLHDAYSVENDAEVSLEANPGTVSLEYLQGLRGSGVNRLSLGVQSASPQELEVLERQHDFEDVIDAVKWARQAGFHNLNLDWIFGLPGQSIDSWQRNLDLATALNPEHLSLYALSIEHGTPFQKMSSRGLLVLPDNDAAADMYELAMEKLGAAGYEQYEISNWARRDSRGEVLACRHNLQYWRNQPYLGLGAGAHGYVSGFRTVDVLAPAAYIQRMKAGKAGVFPRTPASASAERVDSMREMGETMMMGLRLVREGVSTNGFAARFGRAIEAVYGGQIARLQKMGLLETVAGALRLTEHGRLLGNQVFMEFI